MKRSTDKTASTEVIILSINSSTEERMRMRMLLGEYQTVFQQPSPQPTFHYHHKHYHFHACLTFHFLNYHFNPLPLHFIFLHSLTKFYFFPLAFLKCNFYHINSSFHRKILSLNIKKKRKRVCFIWKRCK